MSIVETLIDLIDALGSNRLSIAEIRNRLTNIQQEIEALEATNAKLKNDLTVLKNTSEQKIAELNERLFTLEHGDQNAATNTPLKKAKPNKTRIVAGILINELGKPICDRCFEVLRFHDERSLRCPGCGSDFAPHRNGIPMTINDAVSVGHFSL